MKKLLLIISIANLSLFSLKTLAQKETKKWSIGFLSEIGLPQGDVADTFKYSAGVSLRFSYHAGPGFATLSAGGVAYIPKNLLSGVFDTSSSSQNDLKVGLQIPIKAGYKFIFKHYFFVMAEIGISSYNYYYTDVNGNEQSTKYKGCFTFAPSAGFQYHALEIGIKYETFQVNGSSVSNIALRSGFNF